MSDGGFVVTWETNKTGEDGLGIYGQRLAANVTKVGSEFQINTYETSDQIEPKVTGLTGGGFVAIWNSKEQDNSPGTTQDWGIYGQRYDASGNKSGSEFRVNSTTVNEQRYAEITSLKNGGFVVTFQTYDGTEIDTIAQIYNSSGTAVGSNFSVTSTAGKQSFLL